MKIKILIILIFLSASVYAESARTWYEKGRASVNEGNLRESLESFREALRLNPGYNAARNAMASVYLEMGDSVRAARYFGETLKNDPENKEALTGAAESEIRLGNLTSARSFLEKADKVSAGDPEKNHVWGNYYRTLGKSRLAEQYYTKVIRTNPAHIRSLLQLALLSAENGNDTESARYLQRVRAVNPDHTDLYRTAGDIAMRKALMVKKAGKETESVRTERDALFSEAYQHYSTALKYAESPLTEKKMVLIDFYRGRFGAALSRAENIETFLPDDPELLYKTGYLRYLTSSGGSLNDAVVYYRKAVSEAPDDPIARFSLEESVISASYNAPLKERLAEELAEYSKDLYKYYIKRNRPDKADWFLRRALLLSPEDESMHRARLESFYRENDYELFLKELKYLSEKNPSDTRLRFRLEHVARERTRSLPFRENLFSPEADPVKATFRRTPEQIFIFDFLPEESFPVHPDTSLRITQALYFHFQNAGRIAPVSPAVRSTVLKAVDQKKNDPFHKIYGVQYQPDFIRFIEDYEDRKYPVRYILQGRYRDSLTGLRVRFEVVEKMSGRPLHSFTYEAQGSEALHEIASRAVNNLKRLLPLRGEVIRSSSRGIFLNLGTIDEVKTGDEFTVTNRRTGRELKVRISETGRYASLAEPVKAAWHEYQAGDPAAPSPPENQKDKK